MPTHYRLRVVFHGAVVLLVGLLCGLPTATEAGNESARLWHLAHESLIMIGVWLLATASLLPLLVLEKREASALVWSLVLTVYGFMPALLIEGITETRAFQPTTSPVLLIAFLGNVIGILGSVVTAALLLMGARAALKAGRSDQELPLVRT